MFIPGFCSRGVTIVFEVFDELADNKDEEDTTGILAATLS